MSRISCYVGPPPPIRRRPLHTFSKAVLLEWIRVKGWSYFDSELEGIEARMKKRNLKITTPGSSATHALGSAAAGGQQSDPSFVTLYDLVVLLRKLMERAASGNRPQIPRPMPRLPEGR